MDTAPFMFETLSLRSRHWVFGMTTYGFLSNGQIGCMWASEGVWTLGVLDPDDGQLSPLDLPFSSFDGLVLDGMRGICVAGAADKPGAVIRVDFGSGEFRSDSRFVLAGARGRMDLDTRVYSLP